MRRPPLAAPIAWAFGLLAACAEPTIALVAQTSDAGASTFSDAAAPTDAAAALDAALPEAIDAGLPTGTAGLRVVVASDLGMTLVDLSDPAHPREWPGAGDGAHDEPLPLYDLAWTARGELLAARHGGIEVRHVGPEGLTWAGMLRVDLDPSAPVLDLEVDGDRLYAALGEAGVAIIDLSIPAVVGHIDAERPVTDLALLQPRRLLTYTLRDPGLVVYDVTDPRAPRVEHVSITDLVTSRSAGLAARDRWVVAHVVYGDPVTSVPWVWTFAVRGAASHGWALPHLAAPHGEHVSLYSSGRATFAVLSDGERGAVIGDVEGTDASRLGGPVYETAIADDLLLTARGVEGLGVYALGAAPLAPAALAELRLGVEARHLLVLPRAGGAR